MNMIMAGCGVAFFSLLAFWKLHPLLFMLAGGSSLMLGLAWYDAYDTNLALGMSLMVILYAIACIAFAFYTLYTGKIKKGSKE